MSLFFPVIYSAIFVMVESKVCESLDVRNTPQHIGDFRDCRVIEGNLQVVLMERASDFSEYYYSFEKLYEITGYLIVFRTMNLTSLDIIFPKLNTIGGKHLFFGYALVLYDLPGLEEIGLLNLQTIGNGSVKISSCPNLCYVDTVNWTAIGASSVSYERNSTCKDESCPFNCEGFCWNDYECQNTQKTKCHPACNNCTQPDSPKHCILCRHFNDSGTCVQNCSNSKFTDNELSQCLTEHECVSEPRRGSILNKTCVDKCPFWYARDHKGHCVPSKINTCPGMRITNHFDLELVMGCTHIDGALEIALNGYVDEDYLEKSLKFIVSISDYLKVARSQMLTSLSFFKELRTIKGNKLWSRYYALFVVQNPNLQKLFGENVTLSVENGEALFQENPYLSLSEIEKINVTSNYSNSNGEQICNLTRLNVTVVENNPTNVTLSWNGYNNLTIMGYTVYYAKKRKINKSLKLEDGFVDRDGSPMDDGWNSVFVSNNTVFLKRLSPHTFYDYSIKTMYYSKLVEKTPIFFFKTATSDPSEPVDFEAEAQSNTTINLKWKPPAYFNGVFSHYNLTIYLQEDCLSEISQRNYCIHPHKEIHCTCPEKEQNQLFHFDGTCLGNGNHYCNAKTVYNTTNSESSRIRKRSAQADCTFQKVEEYPVNATTHEHLVRDLRPFTLYIFFLRGCNKKEGNESDHCGGYEMAWQKTKPTKGADDVKNVSVEDDGQNAIVSWVRPAQPNSPLVAFKVEYKRLNLAPLWICRQSQEVEDDKIGINISDFEPGRYAVRVRAVSLVGSGEASDWMYFEVTSGSESVVDVGVSHWIDVLLAIFGIVILLLFVLVIWRRYKLAKSRDTHDLLLKMNNERSRFEEEEEWKLDDETVEIIRELGQNYIGILYRKKDS